MTTEFDEFCFESLRIFISTWDIKKHIIDDRDQDLKIIENILNYSFAVFYNFREQNFKSFILKELIVEYADAKSYIFNFLPVFLIETKQQIFQSMSEHPEKFEVIQEDLFLVKKNIYILKVSINSENLNISNNDLVILEYEENAIIGVIVNVHQRIWNISIILPPTIKDTQFKNINKLIQNNLLQIVKHLTIKGLKWSLQKLLNLSTILREFKALMSFPTLLLKDYILLNKPKKSTIFLKPPLELYNKLKSIYNESQMIAINKCLIYEGISLIQGPPGTGKTTTIIGLLSLLLKSDIHVEEDPTYRQFRDLSIYNNKHQQMSFIDEERDYFINCEAMSDFERYMKNCEGKTKINLNEDQKNLSPKRILVCAASNAAIDEIMKRLVDQEKGGLYDENGDLYKPNVVRIGPNSHVDLIKYQLENKLKQKLNLKINSTTSTDLNKLKSSILDEAEIVCCTLSSSGSRDFNLFSGDFDTVLVDEASQGIEISILIALQKNCRRLILVGDPRQLPATVFSNLALSLNYAQSMFQRFEKGQADISILSIQYRMHPILSSFTSNHFYGGALKDAGNIEIITNPKYKWTVLPTLKPLTFYNCISSTEEQTNYSYKNEYEADFIVNFLNYLYNLFNKASNWSSNVCVITPYASQVKEIRVKLRKSFNISETFPLNIDVNTVDGFQGQERNIVIFSCVRGAREDNSVSDGIGFLADIRRMNVALTRARYNLVVIGNARKLIVNEDWNEFITYTEKYGNFINVPKKTAKNYLSKITNKYFKTNSKDYKYFISESPNFINYLENGDEENIL